MASSSGCSAQLARRLQDFYHRLEAPEPTSSESLEDVARFESVVIRLKVVKF